jgi:hypothetical protein
MIDKSVNYNDKDFSKHLKGLGLSKEEISYVLGETKRKKFEDGGDSGGDSGGPGDSGPGGSDDGSGHGGPGQGDSGPGGSDDGTGHGGVGSVGPSDSGFGIGPDAAQDAAQSISADDVSAQAQADQEDASRAEAAAEESGLSKAMTTIQNQIQKAIVNPVQTAISIANPLAGLAFGLAKDEYSKYSRGVTAPDDYSQATESVQSGPSQSPSSGGGISTIQAYAPTYNADTGNPTMDAYIRQLRVNLGLPV